MKDCWELCKDSLKTKRRWTFFICLTLKTVPTLRLHVLLLQQASNHFHSFAYPSTFPFSRSPHPFPQNIKEIPILSVDFRRAPALNPQFFYINSEPPKSTQKWSPNPMTLNTLKHSLLLNSLSLDSITAGCAFYMTVEENHSHENSS